MRINCDFINANIIDKIICEVVIIFLNYIFDQISGEQYIIFFCDIISANEAITSWYVRYYCTKFIGFTLHILFAFTFFLCSYLDNLWS